MLSPTGNPGGDFLLLLGIITAILWALGNMMDPPKPPVHHWKDWKEPIESDAEDEETPPERAEDEQASTEGTCPGPWNPERLEVPTGVPPLA